MKNSSEPVCGFTLIELLIAVAIMSITLAMAVPAFQDIIAATRLSTYTNSMVGALNVARSEAVKRNQPVSIENTGGNWKSGWTVFVDANGDGSLDPSEEPIREYGAINADFDINPINFINFITYRPDGRSNNLGDFYICSPDAQANFNRVTIASSGRIRTEPASTSTQTYTNRCP